VSVSPCYSYRLRNDEIVCSPDIIPNGSQGELWAITALTRVAVLGGNRTCRAVWATQTVHTDHEEA